MHFSLSSVVSDGFQFLRDRLYSQVNFDTKTNVFYIREFLTCINENHGKQFQELAKKVSKIYHTDIKQYGDRTKETEEFKKQQYKYKVTCKQCGSTWYYIRQTKFVKCPWLYQCGCGSQDFTVEVLK